MLTLAHLLQECIGKMLSTNQSLTCLNVSGNYLGLDFFSRCVGPAMAVNKTLKILQLVIEL